jgi:predicted small lipoprotein YifL
MKQRTKWLVVLLVAVFMVAGCGKKSALEGKVVDNDVNRII